MNHPTKTAAAATAAGLSLLFVVVYGGCSWLTAQRTDIGIWHYEWERFIPFVPALIVPYMSIDLFFVGAPFLCGSRDEMWTLARRITFAILIAGACFLLLPLQMAGARPQPNDWTGPIFKFLHGFDQPYNLFPSLHITLRTILAATYARHTKGLTRVASHVWFSLIGFSTLLTYQHHFVDVVGGFVLATFCFYIFREGEVRLPAMPNHRVGVYYAVGALALSGVAETGWPWTSILLWPTLACALTAGAYWKFGPAIYRKADGRLPLSSKLIFAPTLLGQYLSLRHYRRQCAAWNEVAPGVWISCRLNRRGAAAARRAGVTAVLDLTAEFSETAALRSLDYCNIPILDLTAPTTAQLRDGVAFIADRSQRGIVCVHCKVGYSRSAAIVGAYLLASGQAKTVAQAITILRAARPTIVIRPEALAALHDFHAARQ